MFLRFPLLTGGNRKGRVRKDINLMIVFLVSGLWHGASWNFVIWGGLNGLYQIVGEITAPVRTKFLLTVAPYRADADIHENVTAAELQGIYNFVARLAEEHGVDYLNILWYLEEMDFDFTEDLADRVHLNALGSEKVSEFYGKYLSENYELPDRSRDSRFEDWHEDCREYMQALEEHKALCLQAKK